VSLPYYPMYPRDFFEGTQEMSLEQKGAYIMVLNLMYTRGGPISDEAGYISRYVGCSIRKWKQVRDELVAMGKIHVQDGMISNSRADEVIEKQRSYQDQQAENRSGKNKNKAVEKRPSTYTEPEPEEVSRVVFARGELSDVTEADLNELEANCRKWANGSLAERAGPLVLGPIIRLLKPNGGTPCTMADVRQGITQAAASLHKRGERVSSLNYFEKPILAARDERLRPNPEPEIHHERAGQGQGGVRSRNANGGSRTGPRYKHGGNGLVAGLALLQSHAEAQDAVPDRPEDWRNDRVA